MNTAWRRLSSCQLWASHQRAKHPERRWLDVNDC